MRIHVVDLLSGPDGTVVLDEPPPVEDAPSDLLWVPVPRALAPDRLTAFMTDIPSVALRSQSVVVGLHPSTLHRLEDYEDVLHDMRERLEGTPPRFTYLGPDGTPVLAESPGGESVPDAGDWIEWLRRIDVRAVLQQAGAQLPQSAAFHYEGPNGSHYEAFARPGFALRSVAELDRVAFWLMRWMLGRSRLLVDHFSMLALAYHLGEYGTHLDVSAPMQVESLRSYDEPPEAVAGRLRGSFAGTGAHEAGVLLSVNSSGRLATKVMREALRMAGFEDPPMVALAASPAPDGQAAMAVHALTDLDEPFRRFADKESCNVCVAGSLPLLPIQRDTYLLELAAYTKETEIRAADTVALKSVVETYAGTGLFSVHRTHPEDNRHHAYYVDVPAVLDQPNFPDRLRRAIPPAWLGRQFDVILHPPSPAATHFAELIQRSLVARRTIAANERELPHLGFEDLNALTSAETVLLVDDVLISGTRLHGYRNQLIRLLPNPGSRLPVDLHYLVAVCRPTDDQTRMALVDVTHHQRRDPRFAAVEELLLPNWDARSCSWCRELEFLQQLRPEAKTPLVAARIERLTDPGGLTDDLYVPWSGPIWPAPSGQFPDPMDPEAQLERPLELSRGSVFGDVQDADLAVSVAAAVQRLRSPRREGNQWSDSRLDETFRSPVAKALNPRLYLRGRFYEPVLVAAILRATKRHDLRVPGNDATLVEILDDHILRQEISRPLRGELTFAMARRFLPRPSATPDLSSAHEDWRPALSAMLGIPA